MARVNSLTPEPLLDIQALYIERNGVVILNKLDWTIMPGEHWALVGPNGCGKTALLNSILAYMDMGAGAVTLLGERYGQAEWQEVRKGVGLVSMGISRQLDANDTAQDIVCTGALGHLGLWGPAGSRRIAKARGFLEQFDIGYVAKRPWAYLSQGERSRVLICRALMADPKLLFLDEPCTGMDPVVREHYLRDLDQLMRQDNCPGIIMVTHHVEEFPPALTHAACMQQGTLIATGPKRKIVTSATMSRCFGADVSVSWSTGRCRLRVNS